MYVRTSSLISFTLHLVEYQVQLWSRMAGRSSQKSNRGEARVALDQLTLGVPGVIQLHMSDEPSIAMGTLELVIT